MSLLSRFSKALRGNRPNLWKILDNVGWLLFDRILRTVAGLTVGIWIARFLGPEQFGLLNYVFAFVALFNAVGTLGLYGIVVRDLVDRPDQTEVTLASALLLQVIGALVAIGLIAVTITWIRPTDQLTRIMAIILALSMIFQASSVIKYWFESKINSRHVVIVESYIFLAIIASKIGLILVGASIIAFVWIELIASIITSYGLFKIYKKHNGAFRYQDATIDRAKHLLYDSWPMIISGMAIMLYMRIDQIMLGEIVGNEALGIYSAAVRINEAFYFVPLAIIASVFPTIANSRKCSTALYREGMQNLYDGTAGLALLVAFGTTIFASPLMDLLYGDKYDGADDVLTVIAWCGVFASLSFASGRWYLLEGLQKLALLRNILGAVVNIALNLILIPRYGPLGAAFSTLIAQFFAAVLFDATSHRTRETFLMKIRALLMINIIKKAINH